MRKYYRPILQSDKCKPKNCFNLGQQNLWFDRIEILERGTKPCTISANSLPEGILKRITSVRKNFFFDSFFCPKIVGVLNITPDSFSDGGKYTDPNKALMGALEMKKNGADLIDIGGESTRPGADEVEESAEIGRIEPALKKILEADPKCKISVDTRKPAVMERVIGLGVKFVNDVSALSFDPKSVDVIAKNEVLVCLMHGGLNPKKMQEEPRYENVVLDVYDYLEKSIDNAVKSGVKKNNIVVDPGIGFGKTLEHNIDLIRNASLFHALGVPILYGVSRKKFIGIIGNANNPVDRFPGSIAVALELFNQGVQMIRVHDVWETKQALALWMATKSEIFKPHGGQY